MKRIFNDYDCPPVNECTLPYSIFTPLHILSVSTLFSMSVTLLTYNNLIYNKSSQRVDPQGSSFTWLSFYSMLMCFFCHFVLPLRYIFVSLTHTLTLTSIAVLILLLFCCS